MIKSKSVDIFDDLNKKIKHCNSDSFLNKITIDINDYNTTRKLKLSNSFCFDCSVGLIFDNCCENLNQQLYEKCKTCNNNMYILNNIYNNNYCTYKCYKQSKLDNDNYYNITCSYCHQKFKTINWLTDYCSDKCFNNVLKSKKK